MSSEAMGLASTWTNVTCAGLDLAVGFSKVIDRDGDAGLRHTPPLRFQRPMLPTSIEIERYLGMSREQRWFSNTGPCARLLAERLAERAGAHCVPVASATAGLMAAIVGMGLADAGPAREALMPSFTFPASAQAAIWAGLTPRFVDVDPAHWHLDPVQLEHELDARSGKVALVVAVSSFGTPPPPEVRHRWETACRDAGVPLLIDSAAGFGAYAADDVAIGAQGDAEVVSFHATKPFAVGEGGAVLMRSGRLAAVVERVANFGLDAARTVSLAFGLNAKMSELHAATALAVLDDIDDILAARRRAARRLHEALGDHVTWQSEHERSTWQFVPIGLADRVDRDAVALACGGCVEVRSYYQPLHAMPVFDHLLAGSGGLGHTEALAARLLCLPMANDLTGDETSRIADAVLAGVRASAMASHA